MWVHEFVRRWDVQTIGHTWLLDQLEVMWAERLEDAVAVQEVLQGEDWAAGKDEDPLEVDGSMEGI